MTKGRSERFSRGEKSWGAAGRPPGLRRSGPSKRTSPREIAAQPWKQGSEVWRAFGEEALAGLSGEKRPTTSQVIEEKTSMTDQKPTGRRRTLKTHARGAENGSMPQS